MAPRIVIAQPSLFTGGHETRHLLFAYFLIVFRYTSLKLSVEQRVAVSDV